MINLILQILKNKYVILGIGVFFLGSLGYRYIYNQGYKACRAEWDQFLINTHQHNLALQEIYQKEKQELIDRNSKLTQEILNNEETYKSNLSNLRISFNNRLHESEQRADYYRQLSTKTDGKGCSISVLADYTAKFDRQLTEGIDVVKELTELVKLRDKQLQQCGEQVKILLQEHK